MNPIAWNMRYGLPNQTYLKFVNRYILPQKTAPILVDPFALDVPQEMISTVHVSRNDVETEISQPGTQIIVGPEGRGKTTLFRMLSSSRSGQTLVILLPLTEIGPSVPEQDILEGRVSLLTADLLARHIFERYWQTVLLDPTIFERFYHHLRLNEEWRNSLRWFYHHYPPLKPEIAAQFELMAWLNVLPPKELPSLKSSPEDILRELISFVTFRTSPGFDEFVSRRPYAQIQILIDGTERLSPGAINKLIEDAQKLYDLYVGQMQFKLFADLTLLPRIQAMDCVRQGRVAVYQLPPWNERDLRLILTTRLKAHQPGEYIPGSTIEGNWGQLIPDSHLQFAARTRFVETLVEKAMAHPEGAKDILDAPIHVLRLARALVAACAGCWENEGFRLPLSLEDLHELTRLYWAVETNEEGKK